MAIRVGMLVITANGLMLAMASVMFLRLSYQGLYPDVVDRQRATWVVIAAAACFGAVGAILQGRLSPSAPQALAAGGLATSLRLDYGSFGALWGVLIGGIGAGLLIRRRPGGLADALAPAALVAMGVDRLGGLFTGASPGIFMASRHLPSWFQPFRPWPLYDVGAVACALLLARVIWPRFRQQPGAYCGITFGVYGALRCLAESVRETPNVLGTLSEGQVLGLVQVVAAAAFLGIALTRRRQAILRETKPVA